ncbi:hypothetical protein C8R44DRAFT_886074 [Mycena epipterygia]|nr:hypothetical protein C8R44DRAFT_886074 [Mycena epipterygia]
MPPKCKIGSHYDIPDSSSSDDTVVGPSQQPSQLTTTERILHETTHVSAEGSVHHTARLVEVEVPRSPPRPSLGSNTSGLRPDLPNVDAGPLFDSLETETVEGYSLEEAEEAGGRDLRDLDDPLGQWVRTYREEFLHILLLLEGCSDHCSYSICPSCRVDKVEYRCGDCMTGGEMICKGCLLSQHRMYPLHRVEHWTGVYFEKMTLKQLGLRIQLGHWHAGNHECNLPEAADSDAFMIVNEHGVHEVTLDFCGCGTGGTKPTQLLRARLYPAMVVSPWTAATFIVLDRFQLLAFESKCSAFEFYHSLARELDNTGLKGIPFRRMTHEWNNLQMLKRAGRGHDPGGIAATEPGSCALLCPACPQPDKNLPPDWKNTPEEKLFIYALFLAMDANFRLKQKDMSTEEKDPGLGDGWSFYCEVKKYMAHVAKHWNTPQESLVGTDLVRFYVSYDIACQWHINIWNRMNTYESEIRMVNNRKFVVFLVPKFHLPAHIEACNLQFLFNLTPDVGQMDGEAPERGWANANPLVTSTKEMGPGARRDALNEHFNDWNWKIIAFKTQKAVPEMVATKVALDDMETSLRAAGMQEELEAVEIWTAMAKLWEKDPEKPNPFEMLQKDDHLAKVRRDLAEEAAARAAEGTEEEGEVVEDMHITEVISMGLQLEEQQRELTFDASGVGLHPTDDQRRTMVERTSKLRHKIGAWKEHQERFFPRAIWLREKEDATQARSAGTAPVPGVKVHEFELWMPSAMMKSVAAWCRPHCSKESQQFEYRLRVGQANEGLHDIRQQLLVRTHMYKYKDKNKRGVWASMRSNDKIDAVNDCIRRAVAQYRAARLELVSLGKALDEHAWEVTLKELKDEDVWGRPRLTIGDEERQAAAKKGGKAPPGRGGLDGEKQAMNEALRIEWAKAHARSMRWYEEVDLLEEEMRCIVAFMSWHADWWEEQIAQRGLAEGPQLEGKTVYAMRQATLQRDLADTCTEKGKTLLKLIRWGRAGEDVSGTAGTDDDWVDEEEDAGDSEDEPVPGLAIRPVKETYVDV